MDRARALLRVLLDGGRNRDARKPKPQDSVTPMSYWEFNGTEFSYVGGGLPSCSSTYRSTAPATTSTPQLHPILYKSHHIADNTIVEIYQNGVSMKWSAICSSLYTV